MFDPNEKNPIFEKYSDEEIIDEAVARFITIYRRRGGKGLAGVSFKVQPRWSSYEIAICNSQEFIRGQPSLQLVPSLPRQENP